MIIIIIFYQVAADGFIGSLFELITGDDYYHRGDNALTKISQA